jgi:hypothetical protein
VNAQPLIAAVGDVLQQGLALLSGVDDNTYRTVAPEPYSASIGQHYRHVLDHFLCFAAGVGRFEIDYDKRARDPRLENDREYAMAVTRELARRFAAYDSATLNAECIVRYSVGYRRDEAERLPSVVGRELAFCVGHAVHHYAIVRLLCHSLQTHVSPEFGIAPSTLKYRSAQLATT